MFENNILGIAQVQVMIFYWVAKCAWRKWCGKQVDEGSKNVEAGCIVYLNEEISKNYSYEGDKSSMNGDSKQVLVDDSNESKS